MGYSVESRKGDGVNLVVESFNDVMKEIWNTARFCMDPMNLKTVTVRDGSHFEADRAEFKELLEPL